VKRAYYLILPALVILNCLIFYYQYCTVDYVHRTDIWGNTIILDKNANASVRRVLAALPGNPVLAYNEAVERLNVPPEEDDFFISLTDEEKAAHEIAIGKLAYVNNYSGFIESISASADTIRAIGIINTNTGFVASNIIRTEQDFYGLQNITLSVEFDEGLLLLINNRITALFAVIISIAAAITAFQIFRSKSNTALLAGRGAFIKGALMLAFTILALCVSAAVLTDIHIGLGDLSRSIQSSRSFQSCVYAINTGAFLFLWVISKLAACLIIYNAVLYVMISSREKRTLLTGVIPVLAFFVTQFLFYTVGSPAILREINFFSAFDLHRFFTRYMNLNIFEQAVSRSPVFITFIIVLLGLFTVLAAYAVNSYKNRVRGEAELVYFEKINTQYAEFRSMWHDMQNHLLALSMLIEKGDTDTAKKYINEFSEKLESNMLPVKMSESSAVLDALLYKKLEAARSNNINLIFAISASPCGVGISDYELCSIFGNILDNAIEAVVKLPSGEPQREITLSIKRRYNLLYISCENPYNGELSRRGGELSTSKPDKNAHGIGLSQIGSIVKKHNGSVKFITEGNIFKIELLMSIKNTKN
jgi:sensor histidine kinase YesM